METPRADVFCSFIHTEGEVGDLFQRLWSECQLHTFGFEQRGVLFYKRRLGLGENLDEVVHGERLQFYANGEASLQFGNEVTGLRNVKSPGRDEKNVVGAHHPITRVDGGAFDNGQDVALHTLSRNVRSVTAFAAGNLVDLVEENDAGVLHAINRHARDLVHVDQALLFFLNQVFECLADLHLPLLRALAEDVGQHVFDIDVHLLDALIGNDFEGRERFFTDVDFDHAIVELAFAQLLAQFFASTGVRFRQRGRTFDHHTPAGFGGARRGRRRQEQVQQPFFSIELGLVGHVFQLLFTHHVDRDLDQVAHH